MFGITSRLVRTEFDRGSFKLTDFNRPPANPSSHYPVVNLVTNVVILIFAIAAHDANELGLFVAGADHYFTVEACGSLHRGFAQPPTPGRSSRPSVEIPVLFLCRSKVEVSTTLRDGVSH